MRALRYETYGSPDVLGLASFEVPAAGPGEIIVSVRVAALNRVDVMMVAGKPFPLRFLTGLMKPRPRGGEFVGVGTDFAGVVASIGEGVTSLSVGDRVFGQLDGETREQPLLTFGTVAEHVRLSADNAVPIPDEMSFRDAAASPMAGMTALQALRAAGAWLGDDGDNPEPKRVMIVGASGGVGSFLVQLSRHAGHDVTAVCSGKNADLVTSLGAHHVVDYTTEDPRQVTSSFDVIFDAAGGYPAWSWRRRLARGGTYVGIAGTPSQLALPLLNPFLRGRWFTVLQKRDNDDLRALAALISSGAFRPHVERVFPMAEAVEAVRHIATHRARGKVLVAAA